MAATSLFVARDALTELFRPAFEAVGVQLLDADPTDAEDLSELRLAWWSNDVDVAAEPWTMPNGMRETYLQTLNLLSLPADGDVDVLAAQADVSELLDLAYGLVADNRRLLDTTAGAGWQVDVSWAGFAQVASRREKPTGYAAMIEVRIGVEASRCS